MGSNQSKANSTLPPNYMSLYPQNGQLNFSPNVQPTVTTSTAATSSANAMQQLKDYVKSQVKAESLRRAGVQGADPWGNMDEVITPATVQTMFANPYANPYATSATSAAAVAGQEPEERVLAAPELPAFLTQPLTLVNKGLATGGPQALNYEVVYYAPVKESVTHREFINCFEDCCEDVCENCFLNCCLDCSRVSRLFSLFSRTNETTGQTEYVVMEAGTANQTTNPYAYTTPTATTTTIGNIAN